MFDDSPNEIEKLLKSLKDEDPVIRKSSAEVLVKLGSNETYKALIQLLNDDVEEIRQIAINSFWKINNFKKIRNKNKFVNLNLSRILPAQEESYKYWISQIKKGIILDIEDNLNFVFCYLHSVILDFIENKDIKNLLYCFDIIMEGYGKYPFVKQNVVRWKADAYMYLSDYEKSVEIKKEIFFDIYDLENYGFSKDDSLITGEVLVNLKNNGLTNIGKDNREKIAESVNIHLEGYRAKYGKNLVRHFLEDYNINSLTIRIYKI